MPRGDKGPRPGRPTFVGPDYERAAYSAAELHSLKQTRATAVHKVMISHGGRKQLTDVKDQTVYDAEYSIDEEDSVVWAKVPNREGHWNHLVRTRGTQVVVHETRNRGGETQSLWSGKYSLWKPNGAILRCLLLMHLAEIVRRPKPVDAPKEDEKLERVVTPKDLQAAFAKAKPASKADRKEAVGEAMRELAADRKKKEAVADASFIASISARFKGIRIRARRAGEVWEAENADPKTSLEHFKAWLKGGRSDEEPLAVAEQMPRDSIVEAFVSEAKDEWLSTERFVAAATSPSVAHDDPRYAEFAQRLSSDGKEAKGWRFLVSQQGYDIEEKLIRVVRPDGSKGPRQKHYRWTA